MKVAVEVPHEAGEEYQTMCVVSDEAKSILPAEICTLIERNAPRMALNGTRTTVSVIRRAVGCPFEFASESNVVCCF